MLRKQNQNTWAHLKSLGAQPVFKVKVDYIPSYHDELEAVQHQQNWP